MKLSGIQVYKKPKLKVVKENGRLENQFAPYDTSKRAKNPFRNGKGIDLVYKKKGYIL